VVSRWSEPLKLDTRIVIADKISGFGSCSLTTYRSVSVDWAGGGVVSNTEDLLLFHRALVNNTLLKEETFNEWMQWEKFGKGIDYGYGLVSLRFEDMMFLLPEKLDVWGNWGSISTYMFYNPYYDIYIIGAFNQSTFIRKQVRSMIKVLTMVSKLTTT
jgi:D-alanyl-D-alanine carboxypeptidase